MKLDVGDLRLFGVDLNHLSRWWWRGLSTGAAGRILSYFITPSPKLSIVPDGAILSFRKELPGGAYIEQARITRDSASPHSLDNDLRAALLTGVRQDLLQVELVLPASQVLHKRLTLPVEVIDNLRTVLGYQVGRLTPFPEDKLYYDAQILQTLDEQMDVELVAVPRAQIDPLITQIEASTGLTVSRLCTDNYPEANLFGALRTPSRWWRRLNRNSWLLLAVLAALLAAAAAPVIKERSLVIERKQAIAALQPQVRDLITAKQSLEHSLEGLNQMESRRASTPSAVQVLAELTRLMPDDVYLSSLDIQKERLTINGTSPKAVDLVQTINDSPLFEGARFSAPVSRNAQTGLDQFAITATLVVPTNEAEE